MTGLEKGQKFEDMTIEQKAKVYDLFIQKLHKINRDCGTVFGSYQILDILEEIAIEENFIKCPRCHK